MAGYCKTAFLLCSVTVAVVSVLLFSRKGVDLNEYFRSKRVVLTGASRGIGKSLALQLCALGANVVIGARSEGKLLETRNSCLEVGGSARAVVSDVSLRNDCRLLVETCVEDYGGVDLLILNAAYSPTPQWFQNFSNAEENFLDVFRVNVLQSVNLVQFALPYLSASKGTIVAVSSGSGVAGIPKVSPYATSKHALQGFFKSLRQELIMMDLDISTIIMPLPFVTTEVAVSNWKPIGSSDYMNADECARRMIEGIPLKMAWYYVDWELYLSSTFYSLCPTCIDWFVRYYVSSMSELFIA